MEPKLVKFIDDYIAENKLKDISNKTLIRKKKRLTDLFLFLKKKLTHITEEDINLFLQIRKEVLSNNTYNHYISLFKDFFKYLASENIILLNPTVKLTKVKAESKKHLGVFTEDEVRKIIYAIPDNSTLGIRDRAIIELMYSTGIRVGELVTLNITDIDLVYRELYICNGKGDTERILPVGTFALDALEEYLKVRGLFINYSTDKEALFLSLKRRRITVDSVRRSIKRYKKIAGILTKGSSHALRHSMATHMLKRGADIKNVSKMLGHVQLENTKIYTHLLDEDLKENFIKTHPQAKGGVL